MPLDVGARDGLIELAARQAGLFTTHQAVALGYSHQAQQTHIRSGSWERIHRGVYRLAALPHSDNEANAFYHLWSGGAAVVSHESALNVHRIGNLEPAGIHLTVPRGFRRTLHVSDVLSAGYGPPSVHVDDLPRGDVVGEAGFRVTTPLRSVLDVTAAGLGGDHLALVVRDALAQDLDLKGLVRRAQESLNAVPCAVLERAVADALAIRQRQTSGVGLGG